MRARPGRRTVEERQRAVLDILGGKASVDQIARRLGVHADTVALELQSRGVLPLPRRSDSSMPPSASCRQPF